MNEAISSVTTQTSQYYYMHNKTIPLLSTHTKKLKHIILLCSMYVTKAVKYAIERLQLIKKQYSVLTKLCHVNSKTTVLFPKYKRINSIR